jgi:glyoxylase-like metal-dependent hydrolase (beta-lactamase superfamily II)
MKTSVIHPGTFKLDGGAMFGIIPKPLWERKITPDNKNRILMSLRLVLFETKNKKILIDTGIGDYHGQRFEEQFDLQLPKNPIVEALKEANINGDEITDIVLTHLHFDHAGGLGTGADGTTPVFPNATLHLHEKHLEYAQNSSQRDAGSFHVKNFLPLIKFYKEKNRINLLNQLEGTILSDAYDSLKYKVSFGHTPYMIHPYNDKVIYMADLVPMEHHVHVPWVMGYDIEPAVTTKYKQEFYNFILENDLSMIFEHDNESVMSKLQKDGHKFSSLDPLTSTKGKIQSVD